MGIRIFPQHNVSPKFCNFVWRSRSNILPTRDNLCKKKLIITPRCDICYLSPKIVGHLLWECPRLEMCGRCSEESCRSVVILYCISFYSSDNWLISLIIRTWSVGLWLLGPFGTLATSSTLRKLSFIPLKSLQVLSISWRNTRNLRLPNRNHDGVFLYKSGTELVMVCLLVLGFFFSLSSFLVLSLGVFMYTYVFILLIQVSIFSIIIIIKKNLPL